jgi:hypothetical protein
MTDLQTTASDSLLNKSTGFRPDRVLGWANYLGMSWTWCIGMFLPVLLLRDLGAGGFWIFAIPNICGAAAMGWILRDAGQSRKMVQKHAGACALFSVVTIAFHVFFATWMIRRLAGPDAGAAIAVVFCVFWILLQWRRGGGIAAAGLTLAVSLAVIGWGVSRSELPFVAQPIVTNASRGLDLLWLTPACLFGFLLCPYLDLTFHAARQAMEPREARVAFTLGFAGFFGLMLLITAGYSGWLVAAFDRSRYPILALILGTHLIVQSCFTTAAHARQLVDLAARIRIGRFLAFCAALAVAVALGMVDRGPEDTYHGLRLGEVVYRSFLGFYALAFPAYVWLSIVPPRRSPWRVAAVIVIAAPLFWMAFVERHMICIVPGVLIPLLAKFLPGSYAAAD